MTPYLDRLINFKVRSGLVNSSSKNLMKIEGMGDVMVDNVLRDGSVISFCLRNVLYVPQLERPLISWNVLKGKGFRLEAEGKYMRVFKDKVLVLEAFFDGPLPKVREIQPHSAHSTFEYWHKALGHLAPSSIDKATKLFKDGHLVPKMPPNFTCSTCTIAKLPRLPRSISDNKQRNKLDLIHSDLCGPFPVPSYGGALYYITLVDDATRVAWVRFLKHKSDTMQCIKDFVSEMKLQHGLTPKAFRTDNGGEYVSDALKRYLQEQGIQHEFTPPYSPESNGVAERLNRSIGEGIRSMLSDLPTNLKDNRLWAEAVSTYIYIKNRQPHKAVKDKTPYEAFNGHPPSIQHLHPFGREVFVHIPKDARPSGSKLSPRARSAIFLGYTNVNHQYRIFYTEEKRAAVSADVFFPPLKIEGALSETPTPTSQLRSRITKPVGRHVNVQRTDGFPTDDMWYAWMDRNPQEAYEWFENDHPEVTRLAERAYQEGVVLDFLKPLFDDSEQSSEAATNDDELYQQPPPPSPQPEQQLEQVPQPEPQHHQRSPSPPVPEPPAPQAQPPAPPQPTITRIGRVIRPPGPWWIVQPENKSVQMEDAPEQDDLDLSLISILLIDEPKSYRQARKSPHWDDWKRAMDDEMESLQENDVWDVVERPKHRNVVACRWVFKAKANQHGDLERFKARLVAKGFLQNMGVDYDEIFSPVVRQDSLRFLLAISAAKGWKPRQLDIKTAFLYGIIKEEVYMDLPEGHQVEGMVARLKRCIYGLKQSPREWYHRLVEYLIPYGFAISVFDPCVLVHNSGDQFIAIYVDDLTLYGPSGTFQNSTVALLESEFKVNDMGLLHWLLGIQIDFTDAGITLSQTAFIDKILHRFSMQDCNPISTPIDPNHRLMATTEGNGIEATPYQQIIGSIMYLVTATRPDLAYTITHLSQFNSNPSKEHFTAAKRVLRYIKGTKDQQLLYPWDTPLQLSGYVDASFGNCLDTRRSFSGYIFQLGSSTISWRCRKQRSVATSTTEAEYMALAMAAKHHIWLQRGAKEILGRDVPSALNCDNISAIDIANNPKLNERTKHIDNAYHFTRELVEDGSLTLLHIPSADNLADICTKALPRPTIDYLCPKIFGTK